jgi:hypothetical protein
MTCMYACLTAVGCLVWRDHHWLLCSFVQTLHPLGGSNGSIMLLPTAPAPVHSAFTFECEDFLPWGVEGVFADNVGCSGAIDPLPADPEFGTLFDGLFQ